MACSSRRFLTGTAGRKVPSGNVTPNQEIPSAWVTGVALVNGPSIETLTFVHTLGSATTSGNDEHIVARYGMAL